MMGDNLFKENRRVVLEELPDFCENCHDEDEVGLIKTPMGKWLCFDCYDKALKTLRAQKLAAMREHEKNLMALNDWIMERQDHVETPKNCR